MLWLCSAGFVRRPLPFQFYATWVARVGRDTLHLRNRTCSGGWRLLAERASAYRRTFPVLERRTPHRPPPGCSKLCLSASLASPHTGFIHASRHRTRAFFAIPSRFYLYARASRVCGVALAPRNQFLGAALTLTPESAFLSVFGDRCPRSSGSRVLGPPLLRAGCRKSLRAVVATRS